MAGNKLFPSTNLKDLDQNFMLLVMIVVLGVVGASLGRWVVEIWWKPMCITRVFAAQGIRGPNYKPLVGNLLDMRRIMHSAVSASALASASPTDHQNLSHNIGQNVDPYYLIWSQLYGDPFLYWRGTEARVATRNSEWMKEVLLNREGKFEKIAGPMRSVTKGMFGDGLAVADGEKWWELRRLFNPFFYADRMKVMKSVMETSIMQMVKNWEEQAMKGGLHELQVDVHEEFKNVTAEIISRVIFGCDHAKGRRIFELQGIQQKLTMEATLSFGLPFFRYLPTSTNRQKRKVRAEIHTIVSQIMEDRLDSTKNEKGEDKFGNDLLGYMLSTNDAVMLRSTTSSKEDHVFKLSTEDIIDQCKMFFFAGYETTALLLTWSMMLLAINPEWQERLRLEATTKFQGHIPDDEALGQLKYMGMVLQEALRLYPPSASLSRCAIKEATFGNLRIPKGTTIIYNSIMANHSEEWWGKDANEFRPERFDATDKKLKPFWPFSLGPRFCIGQGFAILEAKLALAMVLQKFSWELSPTYNHSPIRILTLQPQYGMPILLKPRAHSELSINQAWWF